jgi:ribonuclease-3
VSTTALHQLLDRLGYPLPEDLATLAMTHRSFAYEHGGLPTNERLEFLGDMVLGLAVTDRLYRDHPEDDEHRLATWRAAVVSTRALAEVARDLGLGAALLLGVGEERTGGRDKDSILADAMEAVLGAVYLHHGSEAALQCVQQVFTPYLSEVSSSDYTGDWKTTLSEQAAARGSSVVYRSSGEGPDHDPRFTAIALVDGVDLGIGTGRSKKSAEQAAARAACRRLSGGD